MIFNEEDKGFFKETEEFQKKYRGMKVFIERIFNINTAFPTGLSPF